MVGSLTFAFALALGGSSPAHDSSGPVTVPVPAPHPRSAVEILGAQDRRVRGMGPHALRLLSEGVRRSRTFADLVTALQSTDVIVYVEATEALPAKLGGRLLLQAVTPRERYVRVQVRAALLLHQAIEVIAHELQHALEIAADPSVVDEAALEALYRRIGFASYEEHGFDTLAARRTGHRVRQELRG